MLVYQRVNPNISQNPMLRPKPRMTCWMSPNGCGRQVGTNINQHQLLECRSACCWCAKLLDHLPTGYLPPVAGSQCCNLTWGPLHKNVGGTPNPILCDHVTQETCNFGGVPQIKMAQTQWNSVEKVRNSFHNSRLRQPLSHPWVLNLRVLIKTMWPYPKKVKRQRNFDNVRTEVQLICSIPPFVVENCKMDPIANQVCGVGPQ